MIQLANFVVTALAILKWYLTDLGLLHKEFLLLIILVAGNRINKLYKQKLKWN